LEAGDKRGEILSWRGATLINDCYNSNPKALDAMVDALLAMPAERHIVIAGEMLELGSESAALHAACGRRMAERGVTLVLGVRGYAQSLVDAAEAAGVDSLFCATPEEAGAWMQRNLLPGDAVLLKGSRGVRLERALAELTDERQRDGAREAS
jgi:UDP-N-acetylmuramoyl-tripeptide--D-alanyl-D-alanine ligase